MKWAKCKSKTPWGCWDPKDKDVAHLNSPPGGQCPHPLQRYVGCNINHSGLNVHIASSADTKTDQAPRGFPHIVIQGTVACSLILLFLFWKLTPSHIWGAFLIPECCGEKECLGSYANGLLPSIIQEDWKPDSLRTSTCHCLSHRPQASESSQAFFLPQH